MQWKKLHRDLDTRGGRGSEINVQQIEKSYTGNVCFFYSLPCVADNIAKASLTIDGGILVRVDTCRTDTFERTVSDKLQFDHFGDTRGNETIVREVDSCRRKKK